MSLDATPAAGAAGEVDRRPAPEINTDEPFNTDHAAASALEGLLFPADDGEVEEESGASAPDTGEGETPPTGEDEEGHSEADGQTPTPIEPPKSLSDDEKAVFAKLPPEAQQIIARRESDRDKAFTQKTQEIAEERKGWEAERTAIATQRQQYQQSLQTLLHAALPEAEQFARIDWDRLATENPAAWAQLSQQRDSLRQRVGAIQAELQQATQLQQQEQAQQRQKFVAAEHQKLVQAEPDFGDKAKATKLGSDLSQYLQSEFGFTPHEVGSVIDSRMVRLALTALRANQQTAARVSAEQKRQNTPPRVQRPGTPQGPDASNSAKVKAAAQRFGRTGSTRDAAMLLENFL